MLLSCTSNRTSAVEGALRLAEHFPTGSVRDTKQGAAGFLEIFHDGQWGTVCDDYFDGVAARVACQQLGFSSENVYFRARGDTGQYRNVPIHLDDVRCRGGESELQYCSRNNFGANNCQSILLDCAAPEEVNTTMRNTLRLTGSSTRGVGFVEMMENGRWKSLCNGNFLPPNTAVTCKQLGFAYTNAVLLPSFEFNFLSATSNSSIILDTYTCNGTESALQNCKQKPLLETCPVSGAVAISCVGGNIPAASNSEKLKIAISMNNYEEVDRLLTAGVSPNLQFSYCCDEYFRPSGIPNASALICATCYGSMGAVRSLIRRGANIEAAQGWHLGTAFIMAAHSGNIAILKELLNAGANMNAKTLLGETALHYAAKHGYQGIVKLLIEQGADTQLSDLSGFTPYEAAVDSDEGSVIAYFKSLESDNSRRMDFGYAITSGNISLVRSMLQQGLDPNSIIDTCCSFTGAPALICAACSQQLDIAALLLSEGALVDKRDLVDGGTALIWAAKTGNLQMVRKLVEAGANVNAATTSRIDTPLIWASVYGHLDVVKYLIQQGANRFARQMDSLTAGELALLNGHNDIALYLINFN